MALIGWNGLVFVYFQISRAYYFLLSRSLNYLCCRYKTPLIRGEMDFRMDKHSQIEQIISSDLDHWLCNAYFEIVRLPRSDSFTKLNNSTNYIMIIFISRFHDKTVLCFPAWFLGLPSPFYSLIGHIKKFPSSVCKWKDRARIDGSFIEIIIDRWLNWSVCRMKNGWL